MRTRDHHYEYNSQTLVEAAIGRFAGPIALHRRRRCGGPVFFSVSSRRRKREREINLAVLGIHGDGIGLPATSEHERRRNQIQFQQIQWIPSTNKISVTAPCRLVLNFRINFRESCFLIEKHEINGSTKATSNRL